MTTMIMENKAGHTDKNLSKILYDMILREEFVDCIGDPDTMGWFAFVILGDKHYIVSCYESGIYKYQEIEDKFDAGFAWIGIQNMYDGLEET